MKNNSLKNLIGIRIRRQYFNLPIFALLLTSLLVVEMFTLIPLFDGSFCLTTWAEDIYAIELVIFLALVPCIILSILNLFCFGKIICVLSTDGLHHKGGLIKWEDISHIEYHIPKIGRTNSHPAYIDVCCNNSAIIIESAPLYMFLLIKKFEPSIKIKLDKLIWVYTAIMIVIILIISFIFAQI